MPAKDPEARKAYMREWTRKNRDKQRANYKRYAERNAEKVKAYSRDYYLKNREKILKQDAERRKDPDTIQRKRDRARQYAIDNPERVYANRRRYWAKKKYGLTLEEYEAILKRGCAICGLKEDPTRTDRRKGRLCLDHDHSNGKIRDALCKDCNAGIGSLGDDPARLRAAARYVQKHQHS